MRISVTITGKDKIADVFVEYPHIKEKFSEPNKIFSNLNNPLV
jgi:hypothetical protein